MSVPVRLLVFVAAISLGMSTPWMASVTAAQEEGEPGASADASADGEEPEHKGIEEITVTAAKREQALQDVPISMTALSSGMLEDTGLTQFNELSNFVPNLQIAPVTDSRSTSIRIRGIGSVGSNAGVDPSVGVFIDGVYQGRAGMSVADLLDIERVEVLRGPQGTLYGKNTAAGAINIVTKRPSYDAETIVEGLVGNYSNLEFRGSVNFPIIEDRVAARFSGYRVVRDGFDTNRFDGSNVNNTAKFGFRGKVAWDVTDSFSMQLSGDLSQEEGRGFVGDIIRYRGPSSLFLNFEQLSNRSGIPLPHEDVFDRVVGANESGLRNFVRVGGVAVDALLDWKDHSIRWLNAYRTYNSDSRFDGDFSIYDAVLSFTVVDLYQVSSELLVTSPGGEKLEYQGGLYFYYSTMDTVDPMDVHGTYFEGMDVFFGGLLTRNGLSNIVNVNTNTHETYSFASYGQGTYEILDGLKLQGGLRVTWEKKTRVGSSISNVKAKAFEAPPLMGPDIFLDNSRQVTDLTGRASVQYYPFQKVSFDAVDEVMIYASFANGFKSGGFNQLRSTEGDLGEFDDEHSLNYELGARTTWFDRQLTFNLTGFFTDYRDFQAQIFNGSQIEMRNAGRSFSYGIESDFVYLPPVDNWVIGGSLGWLIAEYDKFDSAPAAVPEIDACKGAAPVAPAECRTKDLAGGRVANAPRLTAILYTQYEQEIPGLPMSWFGRADYSFNSQVYLDTDLDPNLKQPATNILNLRLGLRGEDEVWEFTLWTKNLTGQDWLVAGFDIPIVSGYGGVVAPPRQYGGTLRLKF